MGKAAQSAPANDKFEPWSIEIEQALLGCLLVDNRLIDQAAAEITEEDFYDPFHGRLYEVMLILQSEGAVTPSIIAAVMKTDPGFKELDGVKYLAALTMSAPAMPPILKFCEQIKDLATRRRLADIGAELIDAAHRNPMESPTKTIGVEATEALLQATISNSRRVLTPFEVAMETVRELEEAQSHKPIPVVKTGLWKLDDEIGGLRGGDLVTILGKSGAGKSALMGSIALNAALAGHPVIFFSLEMTRKQLVDRMVCDLDFNDFAGAPMWYSRIRNHQLKDGEFARYMLNSRRLEGLPLEIIDDDSLNMQQIAARARAWKARHRGGKLGLALCDYVQIVDPSDAKENRERQVARVARGHKALAKRLEWPVIMGSQMNEADENRAAAERRPRASDARESKAIMNESDFMFSPYRPVVAIQNKKPVGLPYGHHEMNAWVAELKQNINRFELLCLKNRHGRTFDLELWAEMGASAIRCQDPRGNAEVEAAQNDMLEELTR